MVSDSDATAPTVQSANTIATYGLPRRLAVMLNALEVYLPAKGSSECSVSVSPTPFTDADSDGIPATLTTTFACAGTTPAGKPYSAQGAVTLSDTDNNQAKSGFSASFANFQTSLTRINGTVVNRTLHGTLILNKSNDALFTIDKNYVSSVHIERPGRSAVDGSLAFAVSKTYTPDSTSIPWSAGLISISQDSPATLTWTRGNKVRIWQHFTSPSLHWNPAVCGSSTRLLNFDSGAEEWVYTRSKGGQDTLRLEFSDCGIFTVKLNTAAVQ